MSQFCTTIILMLIAIGYAGCGTGASAAALRENSTQLETNVEQKLKIVHVFASSPVTGFPISKRNVITAAHAFISGLSIAAVDGAPMQAILPDGATVGALTLSSRDWVVLYATSDRFQPNVIDGTVEIAEGDKVFVAGFRGDQYPYDAVAFLRNKPEILEGHVVRVTHDNHAGRVARIAVQPGDYHGFSGGPVVTLDGEGRVRVWGVIVGAGWDWIPSRWRFCFVIKAACLNQSEIDRSRKGTIVGPLEASNGPALIDTRLSVDQIR